MQGQNILNFRISDPLKDHFQITCRKLQSNMTAELNRMIRKFIQEQSENIESGRPTKWHSSNDWRSR
jgi:hypothetical protein